MASLSELVKELNRNASEGKKVKIADMKELTADDRKQMQEWHDDEIKRGVCPDPKTF